MEDSKVMIVKYGGGARDYEYAYVALEETAKFPYKVIRITGWLYRDGGQTLGGGGLPSPNNNDKPTFYFTLNCPKGYIWWIINDDEVKAHLIKLHDRKEKLSRYLDNIQILRIENLTTIRELRDLLLSESKKGNSNYYLEEALGYYGL